MEKEEFKEKLFKLILSDSTKFESNELKLIADEIGIKKIQDISRFDKFMNTINRNCKNVDIQEIRRLYKKALSVNYHMAIHYINTYYTGKDPEFRNDAFNHLFSKYPDDLFIRSGYLFEKEIRKLYLKYNDYYFFKYKNKPNEIYNYCIIIYRINLFDDCDKQRLVSILIKKKKTDLLVNVRKFKTSNDFLNEQIDAHLVAYELSSK